MNSNISMCEIEVGESVGTGSANYNIISQRYSCAHEQERKYYNNGTKKARFEPYFILNVTRTLERQSFLIQEFTRVYVDAFRMPWGWLGGDETLVRLPSRSLQQEETRRA